MVIGFYLCTNRSQKIGNVKANLGSRSSLPKRSPIAVDQTRCALLIRLPTVSCSYLWVKHPRWQLLTSPTDATYQSWECSFQSVFPGHSWTSRQHEVSSSYFDSPSRKGGLICPDFQTLISAQVVFMQFWMKPFHQVWWVIWKLNFSTGLFTGQCP